MGLNCIMHPAVGMISVQMVFGTINVVYKLAMNDGMSMRVLIAYRMIVATAFMAPIALLVERNKRPKMTWKVLFQGFLLGLLGGSLYHNLYVVSIKLTTATFAAAIFNLSPAFTYLLALFFRLETFSLNKPQGLAKVLGTAISIGGAMLLTFYKGVEINIWHSKINLLHHNHVVPQNNHGPSGHRELLGLGFSLIATLAYSFWMIVQAKMNENYPCFYTSTTLMSFMGSIQAFLYAICFDREWDQWKLGWNFRLFSVVYMGILTSGLMIALMAWCIAKRGPLFGSIFNPLMLLVTALASSLVLQEKLHLGSILGGGLIILGLYTVIWGKSKDLNNTKKNAVSPASNGDSKVAMVSTPSKDGEGDYA